MRRATALESQWVAHTKSGDRLSFDNAKGGYFSVLEDLGLKVTGVTLQDGTPTPSDPVPIRHVKAGSRILCGGDGSTQQVITVPCELYEGDIWYPMTGKVVKINRKIDGAGFSDFSDTAYGRRFNRWTSSAKIMNQGAFSNICKKNNWIYDENPHLPYEHVIMSNPTAGLITVATTDGGMTKEEMNALFSSEGVEIVYRLADPVIEQYDPQLVFAPRGAVTVTQEPMDLSAVLCATVLERR